MDPASAGDRVKSIVESSGRAIADVFGIPGRDFVEACPNHPEASVRGASRDFFRRLLEFASACGAVHLSSLPGIAFDSEALSNSLSRCIDELSWRAELARQVGIEFAVEGHIGSIMADPVVARQVVESVPGLTLTLDLGHFIAQGYRQESANPLIGHTSHVHARCARAGRLQAPWKANSIDFRDLVSRLTARGYRGWYAIEYVWIDWEHCNEVDNVSETILLRNALETAAKATG